MKLLLDQNISRKLLKELDDLFPGSSHVYLLDLHKASDEKIWDYARNNGFIALSKRFVRFCKGKLAEKPPFQIPPLSSQKFEIAC
jgi:predicted nuclease of predicted toxin-antitoxin system